MDLVELVAGAVSALVLIVVLVFSAADSIAQSRCYERGWPSAKVDYRLRMYCVKRVDQTDVVRPLSEVGGR